MGGSVDNRHDYMLPNFGGLKFFTSAEDRYGRHLAYPTKLAVSVRDVDIDFASMRIAGPA